MTNNVLCEINWDDGFAIPVANAENKSLEDEVQKKQKEKDNLESQLTHVEDRIHAMTMHLQNVHQELINTQSLQKAREKEFETEQQFKHLAEREMERLKQEIRRLENDMALLRERKNAMENSIYRYTQKIEDLKCQLNWDRQALEAWLEESTKTDEDAITIQKYAQEDEGKIRDITVRMERMMIEANKKRKLLDNEMTETLAAQMELDKIAHDFRRSHSERQELIRQWQDTIEQMQKRDQEMDECALMLAEVKQEIREKEAAINEKIQFLKNETENNKEFEKKISINERLSAKLRLEYQGHETNRLQLQNELDTLKSRVDRTATDLETVRSHIADLKRQNADKSKKLMNSKEVNKALQEKLKTATETMLSAEEQVTQLEKTLKNEESNAKELEDQMKYLKDQKFKKSEELYTLNGTVRTVANQISGNKTTLRNFKSQIDKLDHESIKQQEVIYSQDFQIQQLERRLAKLEGNTSANENELLGEKAAELSKSLEEKKSTVNLLNVQLKKLQNDTQHLRRQLDKCREEKMDLTSKIEDIHLNIDTGEKELKKNKLAEQDLMIEDNLLKLEVERLRDMLHDKADDVLSLEKRKIQLETAMKERTEEIKIHMDVLQVQIKHIEQEQQGISAELHERLSKIDKMKKRYELLMVTMKPAEGEEERSQAYYVIKAAQEKEELQSQGDELDAKISKGEKELRALENTLQLLNNQNATYQKSFNKITETSDEFENKLKLEEQKRAIDEKYRYKRRQIRELQEDIQCMVNTFDNLLKEESALHGMVEEQNDKTMHLIKELDDQKLKLERVIKHCTKVVRDIRSAKKSPGQTQEEQDIDLRELRDFNKSLNKLLADAMDACPSLAADLQLYFDQAGLPLPSVPTSPNSHHSSRSPSSQSSASSIRTLGSSRSLQSHSTVATVNLDLGLNLPSPERTASSTRSRSSSLRSGSSSSHSQKS
ncbi:coiled-coil domain-containing protein 39 isoform X1 [Stegostoma tigrinum]|uniref:coiled-coil domain-containing protein 39 isoform X1 n=1 Tax=Stegostoma tigrinum TaxID=3053191 RepID=UPI00202ACF29|nr:coiled-coil domain-containing protein 39 isoform X1 [Stegostoma tigrinum]